VKALILAGGYATRLYPYTENYPKSLLKIAGRSLIEYTVDSVLASHKIDAVYVITNNRFHRFFTSWYRGYRKAQEAKGKDPSPIEIINDGTESNEERLGSIGDLEFFLRKEKVYDDLLVICSDKIFCFHMGDFIDFFLQKGEAVNTCTDTHDPESIRGSFGCVILGQDNRILEFQEKPKEPKSSVRSIAFYIYPRKILPRIKEYLEEGGNPDAPGYFTEWLCQRVPIYGWFIEGECDDVGTAESYLAANEKYCAERPDDEGAFEEVRALVLAEEGLEGTLLEIAGLVIQKLAEWKRVTLVFLAASSYHLPCLERWLSEQALPLPVNIVETEGQGPYSVERVCGEGERYGCSLVVILDRGARSVSFEPAEMSRLLQKGRRVVIREGKIQSEGMK
jgi:glucose-1-phosphate thymidylyltransferase